MYSVRPILELTTENKELIFVHTPKCGGSYVRSILSYLKINSNNHNQAIHNDNYIYFTVIRNPVERFESLLNYSLSESKPRCDWPVHLSYVYTDKTIKLDEIISRMTDTEILGFSPYKTLNYYAQNVDIIITINNLQNLLEKFGYTYDVNLFKPINVSNKIRGKINQENKDRLTKLFADDFELYNKVINSIF